MIKKYTISVIVPFYNSEKTLQRCLDSIRFQTQKDIEIILIDDGSSDSGLNIAKEFASKFPDCKVLTQSNRGPSAARNVGLDNASGEYVVFVDSDDEMVSTMLEKMYHSAVLYNSDLVSCGRTSFDAEKQVKIKEKIPKYDVLYGDIKENPSIVKRVGPLMCDKLFRRSIISEHNVRFNENLHHAEDFLFVSTFRLYVNVVSAVRESLYHYNIANSDSISGGNKHVLDIPRSCAEVIDLYSKQGVLNACRDQLLFVLMGYYLRKCRDLPTSSDIYLEFTRHFLLLFRQHFARCWKKTLCIRAIKMERFASLVLICKGLFPKVCWFISRAKIKMTKE